MRGDQERIDVAVGPRGLEGVLCVPPRPTGLIIFAHGSGSSRFSPRNTLVAEELVRQGFATLLFDLLTSEEAENRRNVFDIALLGARVREAVDWAARSSRVHDLPIGLFGASTGAAAALVAAAHEPARVAAVVSRGGRPDLAGDALSQVEAPTLLIVGGRDHEVLELNREALRQLRCEARLDTVPGATHLFEEPGTLEAAVAAAADWFARHVRAGASGDANETPPPCPSPASRERGR
ncbi:MAG: dienelactone hydrolase family protein [Methylocystis sp.]|nr:dienelactone hydrolase family protein [Methylocystis sp.]MBI3274833.1 dienelactone hydrolase family protein [Methylocystis sp.]